MILNYFLIHFNNFLRKFQYLHHLGIGTWCHFGIGIFHKLLRLVQFWSKYSRYVRFRQGSTDSFMPGLFPIKIPGRIMNGSVDPWFKGVIQSPIRFFDTNPAGRILNRFSKDMGELFIPDRFLPKPDSNFGQTWPKHCLNLT